MQPRVWMTILDALYRTPVLGRDKVKRARALSWLGLANYRATLRPRVITASRSSVPCTIGSTRHQQRIENKAQKCRGMDGDCSPPPAQIPASGTTVLSSCLGRNVKPNVGIGMPDACRRQEEVDPSFHALPCQPAVLAPPPQRPKPIRPDMAIERIDRLAVGGNGEVIVGRSAPMPSTAPVPRSEGASSAISSA